MQGISIGRSLRLTLLGLTVALALVAALGVAGLYHARQQYDDDLAGAYQLETSAANLLAAGTVEEAVLRQAELPAAARRSAAAAFDTAVADAAHLAAGDPESASLVARRVALERAARSLASTQSGRASAALTRAFQQGRGLTAALADRQRQLRAAAHDRVVRDSRNALIAIAVAGVLALLAALALVSGLIARMRRPLEELVTATEHLAAGELTRRVDPSGPQELRQLGQAFNAMAGALEGAGQRIEEDRARLHTTIESLGDALVVTDDDGTVTDVNPRAGELVPVLTPGANVGLALPPLRDALTEEVQHEIEDRTLGVTAARLGGQDGGVVWTIRDISERARLERLKSEFVSTASHELRSPLTSIKGFIELLARSQDLGEREREFVRIALLSTNRLADLINDLLDVARVEAGQVQINRRPIDVAEVIEEVAMLMGPRIADREQHLEVDVPDDLPRASADPGRVRQIVTNLLTNAHLYTDDGGDLKVSAAAENGGVTIAVSDTGQGMTPVQVEHVFDRFYRVGGGSGSGLGLAIVKSLVDLHEGSIDVESEPGVGTTFTVHIPRATAIQEAEVRREALRGKRVLIIEDEPEIAALIEEHLAPYAVETTVVGSGEDAIRRLREESFDAVTLDILMAGMSGFEVLTAIRRDEELARLPVVIVSVTGGGKALAGEWVVAKPIDAEELTYALGSAVLGGRVRVLVVGREELRTELEPAIEELGIDHEWATTGPAAEQLCAEQHFDAALVDAGIRSPQTILKSLDLRGRRLRRSVVVFSAGDDAPGIAKLDAEPLPFEDAAGEVLAALEHGEGAYAERPGR